MRLLLFAGSGQGATNDVCTGAVDIGIVNVVGRSVSHPDVGRAAYVLCDGTYVDLVSLAP